MLHETWKIARYLRCLVSTDNYPLLVAFCHSIAPRIFFSSCLAHVHPRFCLLSLEFCFDHPSVPFTPSLFLSLSFYASATFFHLASHSRSSSPFYSKGSKGSEPSRSANRSTVFFRFFFLFFLFSPFLPFFFFFFSYFDDLARSCDFSLFLNDHSRTLAYYTSLI